MKQLALIVLLSLSVCGEASAELVRGTDVLLFEPEFPSLPNAELQLEFLPPSGFSDLEEGILLLSNDLVVAGFSLGGETRIVLTQAGDVLTQSNLESFSSALSPPSSMSPFGQLIIPEGDSFIGFGLRPRSDVPGPWNSIGWVQFRRNSDSLVMLDNAVQHGPAIAGSIGASTGITVGVPGPRSSLTLLLGLLISLTVRKGTFVRPIHKMV